MNPKRRQLTLLLLLLLAPTVVVGWLGLREIRIFEGQQESALAREAQSVLQRAEQRFIGLLDRLFDSTRLALAGKTRDEIIRALEQLPRESAAMTSSFLLDRDARPLDPEIGNNRGLTVLSPTAVFDSLSENERSREIVQEAHKALDEAAYEASTGLVREALKTLGRFEFGGLPPTLTAFVAWTRGHLFLRQEELELALVEFETGLAAIDEQTPTGIAAPLRLSLQIAQAECELDIAAGETNPAMARAAEESARRTLTQMLRALAGGVYDRVDERLQDGLWRRAHHLAEALAERRPAYVEELNALDVRFLERSARRHALRRILETSTLRERVRTTRDSSRFPITLPFAGSFEEKETSLLVVLAVQSSDSELLLPGFKLDLEILFAEPMLELESRLQRQGRYEVALFDENNERLGEFLSRAEATSPEARELQSRMTTPLRLGPPLLGFSLAATPRDPARILADRRRTLVLRGALLLALSIVAGLGAFLLLRSMRREAELAELKTSFVGRVSHELKTPLALIKMYGETLALGRARDPEHVRDFAGIIARESDRLTGMIDNVLDFSRIEAGRKQYQDRRIELAPVVEETLGSYRGSLEAQGFAVRSDSQAGLWSNTDPEALHQAILNLITNAQKYCREDGPKEIEVALARRDGHAEIVVADRGIGIPDAERDRVFETFYRASTAGERRGAGLGLALIRHFAEAHGGTVTCAAREGGGTVFRLRLPLCDGPEAPPDGPIEADTVAM